jgi:preprotein translocase subunit Sec61beta|tara:strand:- start:2667 stop:3017 length:351 start_codon:yes stop_codon:yes gene_type:complete
MEYDNNLTGALFIENTSQVLKRGFFMVNGVKKYGILVESENDKGSKKFELMLSAGLVYYHEESEKKTPKSPDVSGKIKIDEASYKFGGWNKIAHDSGKEFVSCSLMPVLDEESAPF